MMLTILLYSLFTGLSALSVSFWDFALYRFLTGLGVGGEFAVGVSLVAEVMPDARHGHSPWACCKRSSAVGNITAALDRHVAAPGGAWTPRASIPTAWRHDVPDRHVPALLAILIMRRLKEPERWSALARRQADRPARLRLFRRVVRRSARRRNAIVGLLLASSGVIGLWGIGFFSFDCAPVFRETFESRRGTGRQDEIAGQGGVLGRHDLAGAERRRVLRHLRLQPGHAAHRPQADLRRLVRAGACSAPRSSSGS